MGLDRPLVDTVRPAGTRAAGPAGPGTTAVLVAVAAVLAELGFGGGYLVAVEPGAPLIDLAAR